MGLLQCRLFSLRRAFEGALRDADLPSPAALVRLRQLLPLHTMQLGNPFAFLSLAQPRLLRGRELPLFQRFEIAVLSDALGFAAIDDGFGFPRIVRLAFEERDGPAHQAFTVCAKRCQRLLLPLIDALDLVGVSGDGRVLVFFEAVHFVAVQGPHVVRLPAMLLLLLRFLTLLAFGDRCCSRAAGYPRARHRSTQRKIARTRDDEAALTADIIELAKTYGRYGYRRVTALLRHAGWTVNAKRVQRIWRQEGLKVPVKQPKRGRLWLNDGSCVRLRAERPWTCLGKVESSSEGKRSISWASRSDGSGRNLKPKPFGWLR